MSVYGAINASKDRGHSEQCVKGKHIFYGAQKHESCKGTYDNTTCDSCDIKLLKKECERF